MSHQALVQGNRILHGHACSRPQREMHGTQGITQQHHIVVIPVLVTDNIGLEPQGSIAQQLIAAQLCTKHLGAETAAFLFTGLLQASTLPGFRINLNQESRQFRAVLVAMGNEYAIRSVTENQCDGMKTLMRAIPGKLVTAAGKAGAKVLGHLRAHSTVATIRSDQHITLGSELANILNTLFVVNLNALPLTGLLQYTQHVDTRCARKMIAMHLHMTRLMHDFHIVAALMMCNELLIEIRVSLLQKRQADVREYDSPTIGRAFGVLLKYLDFMRWHVLFGKQSEVQACWASANNRNFHDAALFSGREKESLRSR